MPKSTPAKKEKPPGPSCRGVLKTFNQRRAFGFIHPVLETPDSSFASTVAEGLWFFGAPSLGDAAAGEEVLFDIHVGDTGKPQAVHVVSAKAGAAAIAAAIVDPKTAKDDVASASDQAPGVAQVGGVEKETSVDGVEKEETAGDGPQATKAVTLLCETEALPSLSVYAIVVTGIPQTVDSEKLLERFCDFGAVEGACTFPLTRDQRKFVTEAPRPVHNGCVIFPDPASMEAAVQAETISMSPGDEVEAVIVRFSDAVRALQVVAAETLGVAVPPEVVVQEEAAKEPSDVEEPSKEEAAPGSPVLSPLLTDDEENVELASPSADAPAAEAAPKKDEHGASGVAAKEDGSDSNNEEKDGNEAASEKGEEVPEHDTALIAEPSEGEAEESKKAAEKKRNADMYFKVFPCKVVVKGRRCEKGAFCFDAHSLSEVRPLPESRAVRKVCQTLLEPMYKPPPTMPFGMMPGMMPMFGMMPGMPMPGMPGAPPGPMPGMPGAAPPGTYGSKRRGGHKERDRSREHKRRRR